MNIENGIPTNVIVTLYPLYNFSAIAQILED